MGHALCVPKYKNSHKGLKCLRKFMVPKSSGIILAGKQLLKANGKMARPDEKCSTQGSQKKWPKEMCLQVLISDTVTSWKIRIRRSVI